MPQQLVNVLPPRVENFLLLDVPVLQFSFPLWGVAGAALCVLLIFNLMLRALRPKYYFFVRHGQTVNNAGRIRQGSEGGLTDSGTAQAERTGVFLKQLKIQKIYASPFERTRQTASILKKHIGRRIVYVPFLVERRNPSEIVGKSMDDQNIRHIADLVDLTFHSDDYRYSDEENFLDLKKRAAKALRFLRHRPEHRIAVVTHGIFLKMLISYMLYPADLHASDWVKLSFFSHADNGGITVVRYSPLKRWSATRGWEVLSYNVTMPTEGSTPFGYGMANLTDLLK